MSERVPTEHELRLVARVMPDVVVEDGELLWIGRGRFAPDEQYNDLARFVEAMQGEFAVRRTHYSDGTTFTVVHRLKDASGKLFDVPYQAAEASANNDLEATFWACVEALKSKEERDE